MFLFGLGKLFYVCCLLINAVAILSEDRFLARIGWGRTQADPAFGATYDSTSIKAKSVNLIASVRTVMRSKLLSILPFTPGYFVASLDQKMGYMRLS
ncbi:protein transport protein YOS1 [Aspergillus lentulus]|uniref:Protein transport protein YOS1 n=1 Tax=Aspergillus lentulus TaxID=293939 RepID=A0AAN4TC43_ASPLE|nr:protein transport protein YOS1 [Aspergillus lentulus]